MNPNQRITRYLRRLMLLQGCALLAGAVAWAQQAPGTATSGVAPDAATLAKYDTNKNGRLDPDELAAMQADHAQAANVPVERKASTDQDVVELSPFQVIGNQDKGYYASNTLSGTRINSKIEDLGASITVVTKQQLEDTAAIDINDIFKYEANTEGTADFTALSSSSPTTDSIQSSPSTATRLRGIGSPNLTNSNFIGVNRIPIDTYNVDSVEISRGPNSTLAGLGAPSGTINVNRGKAGLTREVTTLGFRSDSYGGYRSNFTVNRPIIKDKLALRVDALYMQNAYLQKPSYDLTKRISLSLAYRPFKDTEFNGSFESFHEQRQSPNALTPRDGVTEWLLNGKPTWNPLTYTATVNGVSRVIPVGSGATAEQLVFPAGLYTNSTTYTRPTMFIDNGQVQLWEVNRLGTTANPNATTTSNVRQISSGSAYMRSTVNGGVFYQVPGITNKALYDWTSVNAVPTNWNKDRAFIYTAEVVQKVAENLYARAAWHLEDFDTYNRNITNPPVLQIDVNQFLLDGHANPYFLRPYIQSIEPTIFRSPEFSDSLQANLSYELKNRQTNWMRWLGHHQFGGYYESRHITTGTFRYREAVVDPNHVWNTAGALNYTNGPAVGRPSYRYYVGGPNAIGYQPGYAPPKSGVAGNFNLNWFNGATGQWVSEPAAFGSSPYVSGQTRQEDTARGVTMQDFFLDDRVVFTGGIRKDFNRTRNSNGALIDGTTGFYTFDNDRNWGSWTPATGMTRTASLVVRPLPWFGLSYVRASSFTPQPPAVDLFGTVLPNTYAHGHDAGIFFNLLGDKLVLTAKVYDNVYINDRNSNSTIGSRIARVENGVYLPSTSSDKFSLYNFAQSVAIGRLGSSATQAQIDAVAATITQFPAGFQSATAAYISGASIRGTNNLEAKGTELELTYNPTNSWRIKFSGAQTKSINTSLEGNLSDYIALRMPYWLSVKDDQGNLWWTSTALNSQSASAFYSSAVDAQIKVDQALLGKSNPQVKEYTWRLISTYQFTRGRLKNIGVGGSARWDSHSVIGYMGAAPDSDGIVRSLDVSKGVFDPARAAFEFWASYDFRLHSDKIRAHVQLNLQNAFENGRLQAVAVNPDGSPYNYRIINPRRWVLSVRFDL